MIDTTGAAKVPYGPEYLRRVAELVAVQVEGARIDEAKTTESVYVYLPDAKAALRISFHQSYGSNLPNHIIPRTKKGLPLQLDRAVRAAISGARRYRDVPTWSDLEAIRAK